jgi:hypothetical protein
VNHFPRLICVTALSIALNCGNANAEGTFVTLRGMDTGSVLSFDFDDWSSNPGSYSYYNFFPPDFSWDRLQTEAPQGFPFPGLTVVSATSDGGFTYTRSGHGYFTDSVSYTIEYSPFDFSSGLNLPVVTDTVQFQPMISFYGGLVVSGGVSVPTIDFSQEGWGTDHFNRIGSQGGIFTAEAAWNFEGFSTSFSLASGRGCTNEVYDHSSVPDGALTCLQAVWNAQDELISSVQERYGRGIKEEMVIVAVNGVPISPIPEPETYAMMLAGLGLLGVMTRRRKQKAVA